MPKVVLFLVDGMRPDAMLASNSPELDALLKTSAFTPVGTTVMPSVTLPCHMSLIHSVDPDRHGVLTNVFTPQVRPVKGLFEQLHQYDKTCAFAYGWGELKDLYQPESLAEARYISGHAYTWKDSCDRLAAWAAQYVREEAPDFLFVYLGEVDEVGHQYRWLSEEYMESIRHAFRCIEQVMQQLPDGYVTMITADHGGHDRCHGSDMPEDMTIPFIVNGAPFQAGASIDGMNIKDIAPTIVKLLGVPSDRDWEGKALI